MRARPSRRERGFTLVELMVALVAGILVSMAVFTLAKHASGFSMRQSRIADATLQSVIGFERLQADIARAGFLSSPNVVRDPAICSNSGAAPAGLASLSSVQIQEVPLADRSREQKVNEIVPRSITLSGSYGSADLFPARLITESPPVVYLSRTSLGMANIGYTPDAAGSARLASVFGAGRALRIVDDAGGVQFAAITGVSGDENPAITLAASPSIEHRATSALKCGVRGMGNDFVNVVNIVRYDLRDLRGNAALAAVYAGDLEQDEERTELVREEIDVAGEPIPGTAELIAEYAVDLGFSLFVAPPLNTSGLLRLDDDDVQDYAGDPQVTGTAAGPQLIRAVRAWLSVRSQEADRQADIAALPIARSGPNRLRMSLNKDEKTLPPFARVRTLQATIPLQNQARITWQ